jgi:hypothetical protein
MSTWVGCWHEPGFVMRKADVKSLLTQINREIGLTAGSVKYVCS